jgi:predicted MFS family arabinose efflux permease
MTATISPAKFAPLAVVNSIGYAATTAVPFWVGDFGAQHGLPAWTGGVVAIFQLLTAALFNLLTPALFGKTSLRTAGCIGACIALVGGLVALAPGAVAFGGSALLCGAGLGVLLNITNRLVARSHAAQQGYSTFQLVEVFIASTLYTAFPLIGQRFGAAAVLTTLGLLAGVALIIFYLVAGPGGEEEPQVASHTMIETPSERAAGFWILAALMMFIAGQSSVYSYLVPVGGMLGLDAPQIGRLMALGTASGLAGALSARLIGERFGDRIPVLLGTALLAADLAMVTQTHSVVAFRVGVTVIGLLTMFVVPYLFTMLANADRTGRMASVGPAALLVGLAIGPGVASLTVAILDTSRVGLAALAVVLVATALVAASPRGSTEAAEISL